MDADVHNLLQDFAETLVRQDWENAHSLLASGTQARVNSDALARFIDEAIQEVNEEWMLPADAWPGAVDLDGNESYPLASLRAEPGAKSLPARLPTELDEAHYRGWYCISLLAREDQDLVIPGWWDLWMAVTEEDGEFKIAYLELMELD